MLFAILPTPQSGQSVSATLLLRFFSGNTVMEVIERLLRKLFALKPLLDICISLLYVPLGRTPKIHSDAFQYFQHIWSTLSAYMYTCMHVVSTFSLAHTHNGMQAANGDLLYCFPPWVANHLSPPCISVFLVLGELWMLTTCLQHHCQSHEPILYGLDDAYFSGRSRDAHDSPVNPFPGVTNLSGPPCTCEEVNQHHLAGEAEAPLERDGTTTPARQIEVLDCSRYLVQPPTACLRLFQVVRLWMSFRRRQAPWTRTVILTYVYHRQMFDLSRKKDI